MPRLASFRARAVLAAAICGALWSGPVIAQPIERISCQEYGLLTPSKTAGTSVEVDVRAGRPQMARAKYSFGLTYLAVGQWSANSIDIVSAKIGYSWPAPGSMTTGSIMPTPRDGPALTVELKVPQGASLSRDMLVRFRQSGTSIAEGTSRFDTRSISDAEAGARLHLALPAAVIAAQDEVDIELLAGPERRHIATTRFDLSGFTATDWHRANRNAGLKLNAERQIVEPLGPTCKRYAVTRPRQF